jgi:uncharacterized membrane protein YkvA (DUF1232 family)
MRTPYVVRRGLVRPHGPSDCVTQVPFPRACGNGTGGNAVEPSSVELLQVAGATTVEEDPMGVVGGAAAVAGAVKASRGRHPLGQRLAAVLPMLRDTFKGRWAGAPKGRVLGGLAGLAYVISPIDFLPEVLLGPFGLGDDLAIAAVSVAALLSSAEDWLDARDAAASSPGATSPTQGDVIQGVVIDRS